ncbi:MAG: hypothetical protein M1828_001493 [Chrysothrix sp. TS-e1954]|nr:MAG: hypothetical protein M1828_001493 [Chrysothrix sp. TS-e1954]
MAAARLRQGFRFPDDDHHSTEASESAQALDEQEQDTVISTLASNDSEANRIYRSIFLVISGLFVLGYAGYLCSAPSRTSGRGSFDWLFSVFTLLSCVISFLGIYNIRTGRTAVEGGPVGKLEQTINGFFEKRPPLRTFVVKSRRNVTWINLALLGTIVLSALVAPDGISTWYHISPATLAFIMLFVGRRELQPMDVHSLEKLKYNYKGA